MMSKFLAPALVFIATWNSIARGADSGSALITEDALPDDRVNLLQSQVEVKKGEAKAAKEAALADQDGQAKYASATSCEVSEKVVQATQTKVEVPPVVETTAKASKDTSSSLSTILQVMAILLIVDVIRKVGNRKRSQEASPKETAHLTASGSTATSIFSAAQAGDEVAFEKSLGSLDIADVDSWGCTVLHYAAKGGSVPIIRRLAALGASINALDAWDETPLHLAARSGNVNACDALLVAGAIIDAGNAEGCTPLIVAGRAEQEAVCRLLFDHGAGVTGLDSEMVPELVNYLLKEQSMAGQALE